MHVAIVVDERDLLLPGSSVVHQDLELLGNWSLLAGALGQPLKIYLLHRFLSLPTHTRHINHILLFQPVVFFTKNVLMGQIIHRPSF